MAITSQIKRASLLHNVRPIDPSKPPAPVKLPRRAKSGVQQTDWSKKTAQELLGLPSFTKINISDAYLDVIWSIARRALPKKTIEAIAGIEEHLELHLAPKNRRFHAVELEDGTFKIWVNGIAMGVSHNWMVSYYLLVVRPNLVGVRRRANEK